MPKNIDANLCLFGIHITSINWIIVLLIPSPSEEPRPQLRSCWRATEVFLSSICKCEFYRYPRWYSLVVLYKEGKLVLSPLLKSKLSAATEESQMIPCCCVTVWNYIKPIVLCQGNSIISSFMS